MLERLVGILFGVGMIILLGGWLRGGLSIPAAYLAAACFGAGFLLWAIDALIDIARGR